MADETMDDGTGWSSMPTSEPIVTPATPAEPILHDLLKDFYTPGSEIYDVILHVDNNEGKPVKIRASRSVLGTASKVFRALFSERFAEGKALLAGEKEVCMDDPPRALLAMCQLLHHLPVEIFELFDYEGDLVRVEDLVDLAVTVDKYDCIEPLRLPLRALLSELVSFYDPVSEYWPGGTNSTLVHVVAAAHVLDQPDIFRTATIILMKTQSGPLGTAVDTCLNLLPPHFIKFFEAQRAHHADEGTKLISGLVNDFSTAAFDAGKASLGIDFMRNLGTEHLWPLSATISTNRISKGLQEVKIPVVHADEHRQSEAHREHGHRFAQWSSVGGWEGSGGWKEIHPPPPGKTVWDNGAWSTTSKASCPTSAQVVSAAKALERDCIGLCLDCLKDKVACRVPHAYFHMPGASMDDKDRVLERWGFRSGRENHSPGVSYEGVSDDGW